MRSALAELRPGASSVSARPAEPTIGSVWLAVGGRRADDGLLSWPADVFAFTGTILDRAEAYRLTVSPPAGRVWPPAGAPAWPDRVSAAARRWARRADRWVSDPPKLVDDEWQIVQDALDTSLADVAAGSNQFGATLKKAEHPLVIVGQAALARPDGAAVAALAAQIALGGKEDWNGYSVLHGAASRVGALDLGFVPGAGGLSARQMAAAGTLDVVFLLGVD